MDIIITKAKKKILLYTAVGVLVIFIVWSFIYAPNRQQVKRVESQLKKLEGQLSNVKQIKEVKEAIATGYTYTQSIENLKNELATLNKGISADEELALEYLSSSAKRFNLTILSIRPTTKELLLDKNKNRIKLVAADCFQLPVHLNIEGSYKGIGNYIGDLESNAPSLISIENLRINKAQAENILSADFDILIYLKSPNK